MNRIASVAIAICLVTQGQAANADESVTVADVAASMRRQWLRNQAIDITYKEVCTPSARLVAGSNDPSSLVSRTTVARLRREGAKYISETGLDGTITPPSLKGRAMYSIVAFDLDKYQILNKNNLQLSVTKNRPLHSPLFNPPIFQPFDFAVDGVPSFEVLSESGTWLALEKQASLATGDIRKNGYQCKVLVLHRADGSVRAKVYCAETMEYYPTYVEYYRPNGVMTGSRSTPKLKRVSTAEGDIIIPLVTIAEIMDPSGKLNYTYSTTTDVETVSVNEDIPDEAFTIPRSLARNYEDMDDPSKSLLPDYQVETLLADLPRDIVDPSLVEGGGKGPRRISSGESTTDAHSAETEESDEGSAKKSALGIWFVIASIAVVSLAIAVVAVVRSKRTSEGRR